MALPWLEFALSTPVVLWAAAPFFVRGWAGAVHGHANMFTLIGLGVAATYLYSVLALIFPSFVPEAVRSMGAVPIYFEAGAVIVTLVLLGQVLELRARARTARRCGRSSTSRPRRCGGAPRTAKRLCRWIGHGRRRPDRAPGRIGAGGRRGD